MHRQVLLTATTLISVFISCAYLRKPSEEYYGITIPENAGVVFVIDISGSMEGKAEKDLQGNVISRVSHRTAHTLDRVAGTKLFSMVNKSVNKQMTKLAKAKKELIPAIRGLGEDNSFTIIVFENKIKKWKEELVRATGANRNMAVLYLEKLEADGGTNISDALEEALFLAGPGATDSTVTPEVESIFLLSDGAPTTGKIRSRTGIIEKCSEWNSGNRIKLHTIGLGEDCDKSFMRELADKNNGEFIDR